MPCDPERIASLTRNAEKIEETGKCKRESLRLIASLGKERLRSRTVRAGNEILSFEAFAPRSCAFPGEAQNVNFEPSFDSISTKHIFRRMELGIGLSEGDHHEHVISRHARAISNIR
jgi:hypothetical protein